MEDTIKKLKEIYSRNEQKHTVVSEIQKEYPHLDYDTAHIVYLDILDYFNGKFDDKKLSLCLIQNKF